MWQRPGVEPDETPDGASVPSTSRAPRRLLRRTLLTLVLVPVLVIGLPWAAVSIGSHGRQLPASGLGPDSPPVALVLGASVKSDGNPSRFLQARLDLAAELYRRGTIKALIVSGDHSTPHYDEPGAMKRYLASVGVPGEVVVTDDYGLDTYDSCLRAKRVFGVQRLIIVTQAYHLPRAITTCRLVGVDAVGVGDTTVQSIGMAGWPGWMQRFGWWRFAAREKGANLKMVKDVATRRDAHPSPADESVQRILGR